MFVNDDASIWCDWDKWYGEQDTKANREEFTEAFLWLCCEKDGTVKGCRQSMHRPCNDERVKKL